MSKLKSLEELRKIRKQAAANTNIRTTGENQDRITLSVGMATCGIAAGARPVMSALREEADRLAVQNVSIVATGCLGYCYAEPLVVVEMPGKEAIRYANVTVDMAREIIAKHVVKGELLDHAILGREVPARE